MNKNLTANTVLTTNKERTNKEQITFSKKKLLVTNEEQKFRKKFSLKPIADVFILTDYFWRKAHFYDRLCEKLRTFLKRTFNGPRQPEINR